jgi:hypothetical protein
MFQDPPKSVVVHQRQGIAQQRSFDSLAAHKMLYVGREDTSTITGSYPHPVFQTPLALFWSHKVAFGALASVCCLTLRNVTNMKGVKPRYEMAMPT